MPFHGLASQIVLNALKDGQQSGVFVGHFQGQVDLDSLVAGHRRWTCEEPGDPVLRFYSSAGDSREASAEAARRAERLRGELKSRPSERSRRAEDAKLLADIPQNIPVRHPFWVFEVEKLKHVEVVICSLVLLLAGVLCAAGGIGGGGIYVTLLMVAGGLSVVDAVPVSKTIVFLGSLPSLVLNLRKNFSAGSNPLIDYNVCRLVVPSSLIGTFLGVFLNRALPGWVVLLVLCLILLLMTAMVARTTIQQYLEEEEKKADGQEEERTSLPSREETLANNTAPPAPPGFTRADSATNSSPEPLHAPTSLGTRRYYRRRASASQRSALAAEADAFASGSSMAGLSAKNETFERDLEELRMRRRLGPKEIICFIGMLVIVVLSSVFHYHAGLCKEAVAPSQGELVGYRALQEAVAPSQGDELLGYELQACRHPALFMFGRSLHSWMRKESTAELLMALSIIFPAFTCFSASLYFSATLLQFEAWSVPRVLCYDAMGMLTGCLAGLVGIGGGLIFSPFLLLMGMDPSVAVATSSTCVLFTACSTSFQYLLTDRVIVSLSAVYGLVNIVASYLGTTAVHLLMDGFRARRSYISAIVFLGVIISLGLSLLKLGTAAAGISSVH